MLGSIVTPLVRLVSPAQQGITLIYPWLATLHAQHVLQGRSVLLLAAQAAQAVMLESTVTRHGFHVSHA